MDFVGSGCEKAKHHLNPSPKRPKTLRNRKQKTGETLPTEPSKDKDKNGSRRQWMRKGQTPPKSEPKTTKNARNRKRKTGETLLTEPSKDTKKIASSTTKLQAAGKTCPKTRTKDKNGFRRQWMRKSQTPPKSEPKTTKNATKPEAENWRNVAYGTL